MISEQLFEAYFPFPVDVPTARLSRISLEKPIVLNGADAQEVSQACRTQGFFLLDLEHEPHGEKLLHDIGTLFGIIIEVMALDPGLETEYESNPPTNLLG